MQRVIDDVRTAIRSPEMTSMEQRILNARLRGYWLRCEYVLINAIAIASVYALEDSLPRRYARDQNYKPLILFHSVQCIAILSYFVTSCRNPGYLPLREHDIEDEHLIVKINDVSATDDDERSSIAVIVPRLNSSRNGYRPVNGLNTKSWKSIGCRRRRKHRKRYIEVLEHHQSSFDRHQPFKVVDKVPDYNRVIRIDREDIDTWPHNYCEICHFIRPIRSKHCFQCGHCVARYDHHCPLVANCVGANNYKHFMLFLLSQTWLVCWALYIATEALFTIGIDDVHRDRNASVEHGDELYEHTTMGWIIRLCLFLGLFVLMFSMMGLTGFHAYLLVTNQTTLEVVRPDHIHRFVRKRQFVSTYSTDSF